jgi:hypothetical protein
VPLQASHYHVKISTSWRPTAYNGWFWLDPSSLELQRLTIRTEELPPATSMCQAETTLEYHRVHIGDGDGDVLLPRQGSLQTLMRNGHQARNRTYRTATTDQHMAIATQGRFVPKRSAAQSSGFSGMWIVDKRCPPVSLQPAHLEDTPASLCWGDHCLDFFDQSGCPTSQSLRRGVRVWLTALVSAADNRLSAP